MLANQADISRIDPTFRGSVNRDLADWSLVADQPMTVVLSHRRCCLERQLQWQSFGVHLRSWTRDVPLSSPNTPSIVAEFRWLVR